MQITELHITRFKDLYREEYNIDLNNEEAILFCHKLVDLVKHVYKPVSANNEESLNEYIRANEL